MDSKSAARSLSVIALSIAACGVLRARTGDPQSPSTAPVSVGANAPCSVTDYKVLTPYAVALHCKVHPTALPDSGVLVETTNATATQIASRVTVTVPAISRDWLIISWPATPVSILNAKRIYSLTLNYGQVAGGAAPPPLVVAIDTSETVTLSAAAASMPPRCLLTLELSPTWLLPTTKTRSPC
jgi:hypothetical protein